MLKNKNIAWGLGLIVVLAGLLAAVQWMSQTQPTLVLNVDLGQGSGAATAVASPSPPPTATPSGSPRSGPTAAPAIVPTATLPAPPGTLVQYRIQEGDNLSGIAARYGTTVGAILARNRIPNPNLLFVGSTLQIVVGEHPTPQTTTPTAVPPDTPARPTATRPAGR